MDIKKLREEKQMTKIDMAAKIGVSLNAYNQWEKGTSKPNEKNYLKLLEVLEIDR